MSEEQDRRTRWEDRSALHFANSPDSDLFTKAEALHQHALGLAERGLWAYRIRCWRRDGVRVLAEPGGGGGRKWVIDCSTNDYLGMSTHPEVIDAVGQAVGEHGIGARAAAMLSGNTPVHQELEETLARFLSREAVCLTNSGYACQMAVTQGLLRSTDGAFYDRFCHSSLVDGMRLSGAALYRFRNRGLESLGALLAKYRAGHRGALIVTDGVFSTDGTLAPVEGLVAAARAHGARLFVDDAHGVGTTYGGKGCSVFDGVDLVSGTLSKALGSAGGFVAGPRAVIDYVRIYGNAACNTVHVSVPNAAASLAALRLLDREPGLTERLQAKTAHFRRELRARGLDTPDSPVPIIALVCGRDVDAYRAWRALFDAGLLVHALPFPLVPRRHACVRMRLTLGFGEEEIDTVVKILADHRDLFAPGKGRPGVDGAEGGADEPGP